MVTRAALPHQEAAEDRAREWQKRLPRVVVAVERAPSKEPYAFRVVTFERGERVPARNRRLPGGRSIVFVVPKRRGPRIRRRRVPAVFTHDHIDNLTHTTVC